MEKFEQAKHHDHKIYITDVAINKVPLIEYIGFTEKQNHIMRELAQEVLTVSKDINESNEVAITCDLGMQDPLENYGVALGTEHEVNVLADTLSNHILVSRNSVVVVILHNHPSTQTFSLQDIQFFIEFPTIKIMVVVSNQGTIHYLKRDKDYNVQLAIALFKECVDGLNKNSPRTEVYLASLSFLAKCSEAGLYYR